jgi:hypothetical protein
MSVFGCGPELSFRVWIQRQSLATGVPQTNSRPQIKHVYPLNLSILIRGGKETNRDALSNGE